jgi:uncharacterized protein
MHARYFGPPGRHLFGVFEEPAIDRVGDIGVVLCYPVGADYAVAHRTFRNVATRMARLGCHVIRFDYSGTGDSAGELESVSSAQWIEDVALAAQELEDTYELRELALVGLRLGATLAAFAAAKCRRVDRLVLWEPAIDGREYLDHQVELHQAWIDLQNRWGWDVHPTEDELLGYRLHQPLRQDIESLSLFSLSQAPAPSVYILRQRRTGNCERLLEKLSAMGARVDLDFIDAPGGLATPTSDGGLEKGARAVVAWLTGASP